MKTVPDPKPLTLERRPSVKQAERGAWLQAVRDMTQGGKLDTLPRPLPKGASRLRTKLWERRIAEYKQETTR